MRDDARRRRGAEVDAAGAALHRCAPQLGGQIGIRGDAERHAARPLDQRLRLAAPVAIVDLHPPDRNVIIADARVGELDVGDDPRLVVKDHVGIDDRAADREPRGTGQHDIVRADIRRNRLILTIGAQPHDPAQPLPRRVEPADERPRRALLQPSLEADPRQVGAFDIDGQRTGGGQQHDIGGQRAVIRLPLRREPVAVGRARQPRFQICKADAEAGALGAQRRARVADRARHLDTKRSVVDRSGARDELELAARRIAALPARDAQPRRGEAQIGEAHDAVGAIANIARRDGIAAEQVANARIEQLGRSRANAAGNLEPVGTDTLQIDIGADVEDADAFDAVIIDPPVDGAGVEAAVEVGDDDRLGVDARRPQAEVIAEQPPVLIGKIAVEPHRDERSARYRIEPADTRRAPRHRDDDLVDIDARLARQVQRLDDDIIDRKARRIDAIRDRRRRKGAIEPRRRPAAARPKRRRDRGGAQQHERQLQAIVTIGAEIEAAADPEPHRIRRKPSVEIGLAPGEPRRDIDRRLAAEQRRRRARKQPRRPRGTLDRERPVARAQRQPGERRRAQRRVEAPVPARPVAAAGKLGRQRLLEPAECRQHPTGGSVDVERQRQAVLFGHRVEKQREPVALRLAADGLGLRRHLRAPVGDRDLAVDAEFLPRARHRRLDDEPVDAQPPDVDIEVGKQGFAGVGRRTECGQPLQHDRRGGRRTDIDMVIEIGERPPVDPDLGRAQEHAFRIGQREVAHHHRAVERSVEPADADLHPVRKFIFLDLGDDKAAPGVAVETDDEQCDQREQPADDDPRPAQHAARPRVTPPRRRVIHRLGGALGHQKACPIET